MLFNLKALASALLPTAAFAAAVGPTEHLEKRDELTGIDVWAAQEDVDWNFVVNSGISFAYIAATSGISKPNGVGRAVH